MTDQVETPSADGPPVLAKPTGDARADSRAQHDHFHALVKYFDANPSKGLKRDDVGNTVSAAPAVTPNADDAALVEATHADAFKRFNGNNPQVNAVIARMYTDLHAGRALDRDAISAAFGEAIATPESRREAAAMAEAQQHVSEDGFIASEHLPRHVTRGYQLPHGEFHLQQTAELLKFAADNNVDQATVDAFIAWQEEQG